MEYILQSELEEIQKLSKLNQSLILEYGTKSLEIVNVETHLSELKNQLEQIHLTYKSALDSSNTLVELLRSKYGDCKIDLETGQIS
jgi:hypothetical protein